MEPITQLHVARRLIPLVAQLGSFLKLLREMRGKNVGLSAYLMSDPEKALGSALPMMEAVSRLTDDDFNYVVAASLNVTHRQDSGKWMRLTPVGGDAVSMNYADIEMLHIIQLVVNAVQESLASFFAAAPSSTSSASPENPE